MEARHYSETALPNCQTTRYLIPVEYNFHSYCRAGDQIKKNVARTGDKRSAYRVLVGRPDGMRPLGRSRRSWEDDIKMDLQEMGWGSMEWFDLAQDRYRWRALVNAVMSLRVP
jgi:hypothetical protein